MTISPRVLDEWLLTPFRVAVHEPTAIAVIADVHLGYCQGRRISGDAVPLPNVADVLEPLRRAHAEIGFQSLVVAGDLFERGFAPESYAALMEVLEHRSIAWLGLVPGNHDRKLLDHVP